MSRRLIIFANLVGLALVLVGLTIPYRSTLGWIDPVTGSMKFERRIFGVPVSNSVQTSAVERWLLRQEGGYTNRWKFTHETSDYAWGGRTFGQGSPPEIWWLRAGEQNDAFVRRSTDADLADFVGTMREGTPGQQRRAVEAANAAWIKAESGRD